MTSPTEFIAVPLTRAEAVWVAWALGGVDGYFRELVDGGELAALPPIPSIDSVDGDLGTVLFWPMPVDVEVRADLEYRLTVQAVDMIAAEQGHAAKLRAVRSAWRKIDAKIPLGAS